MRNHYWLLLLLAQIAATGIGGAIVQSVNAPHERLGQ